MLKTQEFSIVLLKEKMSTLLTRRNLVQKNTWAASLEWVELERF